ncbi:ProQ/FINO family protein [Methylosinus sp. Sm6]|uniref:ProQ/FINO family protein n=1 Tax=Methylosinus sp. Sm6 TaxID=2866948 RepID=UPI001C98FBB7|nr:ProQ/FinO family protein [Methylosinus sp. Sm6]MBY6239853.1 ProQ/FinO family protein [Methylosinus sp. Sm6]
MAIPESRKIFRNKAIATRVRAILEERFPQAFAPAGAEKKPLKIGMDADILLAMPELTRKGLACALADYTWGPTYCRHVLAGAARVGLDGEPCGHVSDAEAAYAADRMKLFTKRQPKPGQPEKEAAADG